VTTEASRETMSRYFADLDGGDAARHLTQDVVWINEETGERITGPAAVIDFVRALHRRMGEIRTGAYVVGEDAAFIEGDCMPLAAAVTPTGEDPRERLPFVVVYDLTPSGIAAMRLYMTITRLPVKA
jgi:hypothetical protein